MKSRIYFLDNLRTFLIFLVVLLHSGLVYEFALPNSWIVVDVVKYNNIGLIRMYLDLFVMFTIFFISGYFVRYSVKGKSGWAFIQSKLKRIMLPWVIAVLTLIPAYKAIFLYSRGLPQEAWYTYFHFYQRVGSDLTFFANNPVQNWLWFLPVLFLFQLVYWGLSKTKLFDLKISLKTGVLLTFLVSSIYASLVAISGHTGWTHSIFLHFQNERLLVYFSSFLLGALCNKLNVMESFQKNWKYNLFGNLSLSVSLAVFTVFALNLFFNIITPGRNHFFISQFCDIIVMHTSAVLSMLGFVYVLIYLFKFRFNKINPLMSQLNKSSYSVYIIHTIVLGVVAVILLRIQMSAVAKYLLLTTLTFAISNLIIYSWQQTRQLRFNIKTVTTALLVIFMLGAAFTQPIQKPEPEPTAAIEQTNAPEQGMTIHAAVISGKLETVKQLIKNGVDLNEKEPAGGSSPLISAAVFGQTEIAKVLIDSGADVNFKNNDGSTALHTAAFFCRTEIVKVLLANGADPTIRNNAGSTASKSVAIPFEAVKGIYEYFQKVYAPLGLKLDYKRIQETRPIIVQLLQP
ncbi:MAG TPA: ankyrin repeat domain-containing protein [Sunxiuqinia sp.]|nr:ankyrin repeat domain-containing protein [Sunxiuqinia sp.]